MSSEINAPITSRNLVRISGSGYRESIHLQHTAGAERSKLAQLGSIRTNSSFSYLNNPGMKRLATDQAATGIEVPTAALYLGDLSSPFTPAV